MAGFTLCVVKTRPTLTWPIVPQSGDMGFRCGATEPDGDFNFRKRLIRSSGACGGNNRDSFLNRKIMRAIGMEMLLYMNFQIV
jgi:hypothetical protein